MTRNPPVTRPTVVVLDDDAPLREAIGRLVRSMGMDARLLASPREFLAQVLPETPSCLVLDVRLPELSGLDLQSELRKAGIEIPIIFVTGHGDIPMSVRAMKAGAAEFLTKPFRDQDLLDAVQAALEQDRVRRNAAAARSELEARLDTLSQREREVLVLVTAGLLNKQIAARLGVAEITVKVHRGNLMRKMGARSVAELVRMTDGLKTTPPSGP